MPVHSSAMVVHGSGPRIGRGQAPLDPRSGQWIRYRSRLSLERAELNLRFGLGRSRGPGRVPAGVPCMQTRAIHNDAGGTLRSISHHPEAVARCCTCCPHIIGVSWPQLQTRQRAHAATIGTTLEVKKNSSLGTPLAVHTCRIGSSVP